MKLFISLLVIYVIYRLLKGFFSVRKQLKEMRGRREILAFRGYSRGYSRGNSRGNSRGYSRGYRRYERASGEPAKWYKCGQNVSVQSYNLEGGLIYVGETLLNSYGYEHDACLINPKLEVSPAEPCEPCEAGETGDEMSYGPQYGRIPARCRGAYLKWLADGRAEPKANIGYVFLFFFGLERRLLIDGQKGEVSDQERLDIVNEVRRLLKIYGSNRSFKGYASNFLALEWVLYQSDKPIPDYLDLHNRYYAEPFRVLLAQYAVKGRPIPADVALQWLSLHPEYGLPALARRCAKEFRELFTRRYAERFGQDGLVVKANKTRLKYRYRGASPSMRGDLKLKVPDLPNPFVLSSPLNKLSDLAKECTVELEAYNRYLGRKNNDPKSMAALALLPKELIAQVPYAEQLKISLDQVCASGPGLMAVDALWAGLGEQAPSRLGKKEGETLATLIEGLGFGMAPDIRFHDMKPYSGGKIAIFRQGHGAGFSPSREFRTYSTILRLGAMVSNIDNHFSPSKEASLQALVKNNRELTDIEKNSLLTFLHWCLRTPQNTAGLKQRLAEINTAEKAAISRILISVAYADGCIAPLEMKQLEKLYTSLGLDKERVIGDIHALAASSEPVIMGLRDPEISFTIPGPAPVPETTSGFYLNEELIRIREEETRQVKTVLEGIFSDQAKSKQPESKQAECWQAECRQAEPKQPKCSQAEPKQPKCSRAEDEVDPSSVPCMARQTSNPLAVLDKAHQDFFHRLLSQEIWDRSALHEMCKELGLMVDGAMEVLNEWAYHNANAPLIEDGEPVYVDINLAREIIDAQ